MPGESWDRATVELWTKSKSNWGRWGADDQLGAANLIDDAKRLRALSTVRLGKTISLSRPMSWESEDDGIAGMAKRRLEVYPNAALEFLDLPIHMTTGTHIDALQHLWDEDGIYNGHQPGDVFADGRCNWDGVDSWRDGLLTRGVLLDIPRFRGVDCVTLESPPEADELEAVARAQNVSFEPGDALVIYMGREAWEERNGSYCVWLDTGSDERSDDYFEYRRQPGLAGSSLRFIREIDCSILVWDMMEEHPHTQRDDLIYSVHSALWAYGVALIDAASLEVLARQCYELKRYEFALLAAPLRVPGGTGSPVNPIAIL